LKTTEEFEAFVKTTSNCSDIKIDSLKSEIEEHIQSSQAADPREEQLVDDDHSNDNCSLDSIQQSKEYHLKHIELLNYQLELARPGLYGKNCIICAPTGSDKALIAAYVCQQIRHRTTCLGNKFKAFFVVSSDSLMNQKLKTFYDLIEQRQVVVASAEKEKSRENRFSQIFEQLGIDLCPAVALLRLLKQKDVHLSNWDLIIIDQCHDFTNAQHPYSDIMQFYFGESTANTRMPQIIGLTSGIGCNDASSLLTDLSSLCAYWNCHTIARVHDHVDEISELNPKPDESQIITVSQSDHHFRQILVQLMSDIEQSASPPLNSAHVYYGSQKYARLVKSQRLWCVSNSSECAALQMINFALMLQDDTCAEDALMDLDARFNDEDVIAELDLYNVRKLYRKKRDQLQRIVETDTIINCKLEKLSKRLYTIFQHNSKAKGLIVTRSTGATDFLHTFISNESQLKDLIQPAKHSEINTDETLHEEEIEAKFNLFIASANNFAKYPDKPSLDFIILYNTLPSEIDMSGLQQSVHVRSSQCFVIANEELTDAATEFSSLLREHDTQHILYKLDLLELSSDIEEKKAEFNGIRWINFVEEQLVAREEIEERSCILM